MEQVPLLVATAGPLKGQRFLVSETGLMLGRESTCDVVIPDKGVSREHARLLLHNGTVWVQDAGSRNGVYVNQKRVMRHRPMGPGDSLTIGSHAFTLELSAAFPDENSVATVQSPPNRRWTRWILAALLGAAVVALVVSALVT